MPYQKSAHITLLINMEFCQLLEVQETETLL